MRFTSTAIFALVLSATAPDGAALSTPRGLSATARSIGSPNEGHLDGGARLGEAPYLRVVPFYAESNARFGLPELVGLLDRAARRVARRFPDAILSVGDLSRRGGGELERHHSHESGRDADVGFYLRGPAKKSFLPDRFLPIAADGKAKGTPGAAFDEPRNWALIEALIEDPEARVSHIFIASHLRARLLRYAEAAGVARGLRERAAEVMMQPHRALLHDDHFHVRIACPEAQRASCVEQPVLRAARGRPSNAPVRRRATRELRSTGGRPVLDVVPTASMDP